jgi:hypothetical protein
MAGTKTTYRWQVQGDLFWFHFTNAAYAEQIAQERYYVVGPRQHQKHGSGLFVTTRNPLEMSADQLLSELFARQRPHDAVEAVVVLRRGDEVLPMKKVGHSSYLHAAPVGEEIDLAPVFVGFGIRRSMAPDGWLFSGGLYVSKPT